MSDFPKAIQLEGDITKIQVLLPSLALSSTVLPCTHMRPEHSYLTRPLYFLKHSKTFLKEQKQKQNPIELSTEKQRKPHSVIHGRTSTCLWPCLVSLPVSLAAIMSALNIHLTHLREQEMILWFGMIETQMIPGYPDPKKEVPYNIFFFKLQIHWVVMAT